MDEIKDIVAQALERKRVLSRLRAELRAQVFLAIDEQEQQNGNEGLGAKTSTPQREGLLQTPEGMLLVRLIREFLTWASMDFTALVYEPELGPSVDYKDREELARQLGILVDHPQDGPLLLPILKRFQAGGGSSAGLAPLTSPSAPAGRLSSLAPLGGLPRASSEGPLKSSLDSKTSGGVDDHAGGVHEPPKPLAPPPAAPAPLAPAPPRPLSSLAPPPIKPAPPPPAPPAQTQSTPTSPAVEPSYTDDIEIESDDGLDGAEIMDEDEDLSAVLGGKPSTGAQSSAYPHISTVYGGSMSGSGATGAQRPGSLPPADRDDLSESSLSSSSIQPGRIRPGRSRMGSHSESGLDREDFGTGGRMSAGGRDLLASGDRSFGMSHELGVGAGHSISGGLSFSGELPYDTATSVGPTGAGLAAAGAADDGSEAGSKVTSPNGGSLSRSGDSLRPFGKLDPLGKPSASKLAPLAPLKPLAGGGSSAAPAPVAPAPVAGPSKGRKDPNDIKEELRRAGLLTTEPSSGSMDVPSAGGGGSNRSSSSGGLELPDNTPSGADSDLADSRGGYRRSISGGGSGMGRRSSGGGRLGSGGGAAPPGGVKSVRGGVYDAEFSVSMSMDIPAEIEEEELQSSQDSAAIFGRNSLPPNRSNGGGPFNQGSRGLSMDMRDTGLSASDLSGELDQLGVNADFAETAELG